jgi:hypothetical protein
VSVPITSAGVSLPVDVDFVFVAEGRTTLTLTFQSVSEAFPLGLEQILANAAIDRASTF